MYCNQEYRSADQTVAASEQEAQNLKKVRQKGSRFGRKAIAFALLAAILGAIAGGAFYGVNALLDHLQAAQTQDAFQEDGITVSGVSYSYNSAAASPSLDVSGIAAQGLPSVVSVTNISVQEVQTYFGQLGRSRPGQMQLQETVSCGSGVIIYANDTDLYMVTNYHVVEDATSLSVTFVDDQTYAAQLCGFDEAMDIALLKVSVASLSADTLSQISVVSIGDSDALVVGEQVVAIGNALGYGQSVTTGIVSALDRAVSTDTGESTYIQTDAAINPGNSGGALFNMRGELIGINTAKVASTDVEGMGYAIPISQVLELINALMN